MTSRSFLGLGLGRGWRFPIETSQIGGIAQCGGEDAVRAAILVILGTAPGERLMRPTFGCRIHDLLFAPNNANTAGLAAHYCVDALRRFEPRITEVEAEAAPSAEQPNQLQIRIRYKVRQTGMTHNMVHPFYLRGGEESP